MNRRDIPADIDEVMYSCGLEILHPGGLKKSEEMAIKCGIAADKKVLDIGSGKGATACFLARHRGCRITGVDHSEAMTVAAVRRSIDEGLTALTDFICADALSLPFEDMDFDIILIECVTTLLNRQKAFKEILRVLKPGGYIGDLEMTWKMEPQTELKSTARKIWNGFDTMTETGWIEFLKAQGLNEITAIDFSNLIPAMRENMINELGLRGLLRLAGNLITKPKLLISMMKYSSFFKKYSGYIGYGYFTARKSF